MLYKLSYAIIKLGKKIINKFAVIKLFFNNSS